MSEARRWWKEAVVYQIYPRSFCDSNGDGVGDLKGILEKLDYLKELGVTVLWLCPIYRSPNDDNGYDISDYRSIQPEFGTMEDFETLLREAHARGLRLIMDLVVNHTSDEHAWFAQSRASQTGPKRDYYIWRPGKDGREPNNWASFFTPSAWERDPAGGEYYLHLFSKKQPDLNWENPRVRENVYSLMEWWLQKGIDGFRMDVINCISKTPGLPDVPAAPNTPAAPDAPAAPGRYAWAGEYFLNGPRVHEYLREMNRRVLSRHDILTVGETPGAAPEDALRYAGENGEELNMVFQSELMDVDAGPDGKWEGKPWRLEDFKRIVSKWQRELSGRAWNSVFLGNHDQPRMVSRFGDDGAFRTESATLLATLLLTLKGTPYIFQGDELGMTNMPFASIGDCRDIESLQYYEAALRAGTPPATAMERIRKKGRDNARTPMQWSAAANAGFTSGRPWIAINPNFPQINAESERRDENSVFRYYRALIRLRRETPALVYGEYRPLCEESDSIFAYERALGPERLLIALNFSGAPARFRFPETGPEPLRLLLRNRVRPERFAPEQFAAATKELELLPWEACVFRLSGGET